MLIYTCPAGSRFSFGGDGFLLAPVAPTFAFSGQSQLCDFEPLTNSTKHNSWLESLHQVTPTTVLFCSFAVLDPRVGHNMDVLSPFIPVLCHSDWLFHGQSSTSWCCQSKPCVVFLACVHLALFLALSLSPGNSLVSSWCDHSMLAYLLWRCLTVFSLLHLC